MLEYFQIYLSRPTVVVADVLLLILATLLIVGIIVLRRKIDNLSISIILLRDKLTHKQDNSQEN